MSADYRLSKFTKEQLEKFEEIEKRVLTESSVLESLNYILIEIYRFGNYIVERITEDGKNCIRLREKNNINSMSINSMLEGIEEYWDELSIKERIYVDRIRRLYELQLGLFKLTSMFPKVTSLKRRKMELTSYKEGAKPKDDEQTPKLKNFQRGELQKELELLVKEYGLQIRESAPMTKVRIITKKLINNGWDAKETSVAEALRKMGFVRSVRK